MIFDTTSIREVRLVRLDKREDARGSFARAFCAREFADQGLETNFVQANIARTEESGTVRGMHYQVAPDEEVKLIRCVAGAIYDVVSDMRPESPTYLQSFGAELTAENGAMMYVPRGFAHGYQALTAGATAYYMVSDYYAAHSERGVRYDDPALGIDWPLPARNVSDKDLAWPLLSPAA